MFTGIIEDVGEIISLTPEASNIHFKIKCRFTEELKVDQSISHNGVCLTVTGIDKDCYTVTVIKETLNKSNLGQLNEGSRINLERAMKLGDRLDGHLVQGHVDQTAVCTSVKEADGSWYFSFSYDNSSGNITIEKGSITINGVSLTVVNSTDDGFSVAVIPYTYAHTTFSALKEGDVVNLEFDLVGKYLKKLLPKS